MTTCKLFITCSCCSQKVDLMECINNFQDRCYYCNSDIVTKEEKKEFRFSYEYRKWASWPQKWSKGGRTVRAATEDQAVSKLLKIAENQSKDFRFIEKW